MFPICRNGKKIRGVAGIAKENLIQLLISFVGLNVFEILNIEFET